MSERGASSSERLSATAERALDLTRRAVQVVQRDGLRVVVGSLLARRSTELLMASQPFRTDARLEDLLAAPGGRPPVRPGVGERPLVLNWITNPPTDPSGGLGTLMRAIGLLEARGHECRIYVLYKGTRRTIERDRAIARERFPAVRAEIEPLDVGMRPADGVVATGWPTAYVARADTSASVPFYFVQDFEPAFYPASSNGVLAEATYGFGFHGITAGPWLSVKLGRDYGMACDYFDLGVDLGCYHLDDDDADAPARSGIVFYARPGTARRGFELGMMTLDLFARRHPEIPIHLVGQRITWARPTFRFEDHGFLPPRELAALYRRCTAGLVLSLTNLSLLPAELLACGCVPVMNDAEHTRGSFDNPAARFAPPVPAELAAALSEVVASPPGPAQRAAEASSVAGQSWEHVGDQLDAGFRRGMSGRSERELWAG
jgi:hypothetical protein